MTKKLLDGSPNTLVSDSRLHVKGMSEKRPQSRVLSQEGGVMWLGKIRWDSNQEEKNDQEVE